VETLLETDAGDILETETLLETDVGDSLGDGMETIRKIRGCNPK
jgi:hypothetical protein